jgi:putative transposase
MSRPIRFECEGGVYHVIARGNERRAIFRDDTDREGYLHRLAHYRRRFGFRLYAYCLMTNHLHLAIETSLVPLSRILLGLQGSYAQAFNRRHERVGHLFQGRYKAFVVQKTSYLLALIQYIHGNPVRAGIVREARFYRWSSARFYAGEPPPAWLDVESALGACGADVAYAESGGPVKGDERFTRKAYERANDPDRRSAPLSIERIARLASKDVGVDVQKLCQGARGPAFAEARGIVAYLARSEGRIPLARTAGFFRRDPSTLVRDFRRIEARLATDADFRRILRALRQKLEV